MAANHTQMIFVNLAVKDPQESMKFFGKLGFEFNPKFTDEKAACMIINDQAYVMLLAEPFFQTFTTKRVCDTATHTEGLLAITRGSRAGVDETVDKAIAAGGTPAMETKDLGFMYYRCFYDLDAHHWEVVWMDPKAAEG